MIFLKICFCGVLRVSNPPEADKCIHPHWVQVARYMRETHQWAGRWLSGDRIKKKQLNDNNFIIRFSVLLALIEKGQTEA